MGKGIPERWECYTNMGRQIPGTRFFAFKVPLKDALLNNLPPSVSWFGPRTLMDHCSSLGLVIDLTNTTRYYDPQVFQTQNIQYAKLNTAGHVIPNTNVVKQFFRIVEKFFEENDGNDKLIGVHCTHGINRTGYLICRYLIQQLGVPPDQAISDFNSARGHEQERKNYLKDLRIASWRSKSTAPSPQPSQENLGETRRRSNSETFTPPYLPHQSRRASRFSWQKSPQNESRLSRSPYGERRSGWSPYGPERLRSWNQRTNSEEELSSPPERRGRKRSASYSTDPREEQRTEGESFKSPKFGKLYYEQYYKGQVLPQYDVDFYNREGGGVGPHRPQPRYLPPTQGDGRRPRQYRGPKPYRTPPKEVEPLSSSSRTPAQKYKWQSSNLAPVEGPDRNPLSPGASSSVFSPENEYGRRRSQRFQPY